MFKIKSVLIGATLAAGLMALSGSTAIADHEHRRDPVSAVPQNETYTKECSSCHFPYTATLLPAKSWIKLVQDSEDHFGEALGLDEAVKSELTKYLVANSAENSRSEWSRAISRNSGNGTLIRITEMPYIIKEHRKIKEDVFKRPSIGSRSNCGACHTLGAQGDYEEESLSIPRQ